MKLIIPIYFVAIGCFLTGLFDIWIFLSGHRPSIVIYGAIFNMIGIASALIATALRSQNKRIEKCERYVQNITQAGTSPDDSSERG